MLLSPRSSLEIEFTEGGTRRSFSLTGSVDDSDPEFPSLAASVLHSKPARVEFCSPIVAESVEKIHQSTGVQGASGIARVSLNGEPERFEIMGESVIGDAVRMQLSLDPELFSQLHQLASKAELSDLQIALSVELLGNALPQSKDDKTASIFGFRPADLDLSSTQVYAIRNFKAFVTRYPVKRRSRIGSIDGSGLGLDILLSTFRYDVDLTFPLLRSIRCEGRVIKQTGKPIDGASCEVRFRDASTNRLGEWPEQAFWGSFNYYGLPEFLPASGFSIDLLHMPDDLRELLLPLLTLPSEYQVIISVKLATAEEDLIAPVAQVQGNIRGYGLTVFRN